MAKSKNMPKAAIADIRRFYERGQASLSAWPKSAVYGHRALMDARRWSWSAETMRTARQFADPVRGYTAAEVEELCHMIEEREQAAGPSGFGRTHVIRLLTVPRIQRAALQRRAIQEGWSITRLETEVSRRFGARKHGGRLPAVAADPDGVYVQLEKMCEQWRRWHAAMVGGAAGGRKQCRLDELGVDIQRVLGDATRAIDNLQRRLTEELRARHPRRNERFALRQPGVRPNKAAK